MKIGRLITICGECASYDYKKHKCKLGCKEGSSAEPFYTDCPLPEVDEHETKHGKWTEDYDPDNIICSVCGKCWNKIDNCTETFNHCPNCGAKMDKEETV